MQELWDNYKRYNTRIMGILKVGEREKNSRNIWNNNDWQFPQNIVTPHHVSMVLTAHHSE